MFSNRTTQRLSDHNDFLRHQFGFLADPDLPRWKNHEEVLQKMPPTTFLARPRNRRLHNCLTSLPLPRGARPLLGLGLKYCVRRPRPTNRTDTTFERFRNNIRLKQKMCLPLWPDNKECICFCGKKMDQYGHVLLCRRHCKTPLSNKIQDGLCEILKPICKTVKLISQENMIDKEQPRVITKLPHIRHFDISILLDHMLDKHT